MPRESGWDILVFITKGNTYTWGVSLHDMLWKVMESIIDTRLRASIQFHNVLHGFHAGGGMGTGTMELKIAQELDRINQYPLFLVLLNLRKA